MNNLNISFLCVQPIHIDNELYMKMLKKNISYNQGLNISTHNSNWLNNFNQFNDVYKILEEVKLNEITIDYLKRDLNEEKNFPKNNEGLTLPLSSYLDIENTTYTLYFDIRFLYFVLVYDIHFNFPKDILNSFLDYNPIDDNLENKDFYNTIRNLVTKENNESILSSWSRYIQNDVLNKIKEHINTKFNIKTNNNELEIQNNTCNISCFIYDKNFESNELVNKFVELNVYAERVTKPYEVNSFNNDKIFYSFHGRFHTIYFTNEQDKFRFQPLQFHIQYMWFLLKKYNKLMNEINLDLMQEDSLKSLRVYSKIIHRVINKIELLSLHDNNFKYAIEIDYKLIYSKNESYWSLPELLSASKQYINFFKDHLDRLFLQKNDLFQKKQNYILLVISILQLIALISVWTDYLSLLNINNLNIDSRLLDFFDTSKNLLSFNLYLPEYIFGIISLILIYLFIKNND